MPYAAKSERKTPNKIIHLSATNDSLKGKTIHENEAKPVTNKGIFSKRAFFNNLSPIIAVGTSITSTTANNTIKFVGL
jgi:hypothetical protein